MNFSNDVASKDPDILGPKPSRWKHSEKELIITSSWPGFSADQFSIRIVGNSIEVVANSSSLGTGKVSRVYWIPDNIDRARVQYTFEKGFVSIHLPFRDEHNEAVEENIQPQENEKDIGPN